MTSPEAQLLAFQPKPPSSRRLPSNMAGAPLTPPPSLRDKIVSADRVASIEVKLALLWRELMNGACRVEAGFFGEERYYLVLSAIAFDRATRIEGRRREILESVLCGQGQKNISIDLRVAPSTVALNARLGLASLGVGCKPSRVHPLLMLAARASREGDSESSARLSFVEHEGRPLRVIAAPRPDRRLSSVVPPAELAVVRSLVEGLCYDDIARQRGTSTRTIANQITAVFRRMRVSGRNELLQRLFEESSALAPVPRAKRHSLVAPLPHARQSA